MIEWSWIHGLSIGLEVVAEDEEGGVPYDTWVIDLLVIRIIIQPDNDE